MIESDSPDYYSTTNVAATYSSTRDRQACSGYYVYTSYNLYLGCSSTSYSCYFVAYVSYFSRYTSYFRAISAHTMRSYFP
jgi:hypothetical protein